MPGWIRERDAMSASYDTPPHGSFVSSFYKGNASATSTKSSGQKKTSNKGTTQTSLKNHFAKLGGGEKTLTAPSWLTSLYTGKGNPGDSNGGGTRREAESPNDLQGKRKRSPDKVDQIPPQKRLRKDEQAPAPSFNLMSIFGQPPQSSLAIQPRTPTRRKAKATGSKPAPAISPSKRKELVVDSARDVAVQQHRQWQRSSSPLQAIDNIVGQRKKTASATPRASTGLTPSKLRHGYSMIAFDDELYPDMENTQHVDSGDMQEDEASEEQDAPSSPSEERQERAGSTPKLPFTRSPRSHKRVYAQETQPDDISPLQKHYTLRGTGVSVEVGKKHTLLDDSDPLSTPPPTSPKAKGAQVIDGDNQLRSSPTAAGGSFNTIDESIKTVVMESYVSEEDEEEDLEQRRGCGDETFRLPSSQDDFVTPIRPSEIKSKLRSNTKSPQKQVTTHPDEELSDQDSDTQPLSWGDDIPDAGTKVSQRINASWADVNKVWMEVDLGQDREGTASALNEPRQSSLHSFGFETKHHQKHKKVLEVNRDIAFDSDEGVESDAEDDDSEATQELPWSNDEHDEQQSASPALSMLPSEGDLDSQTRYFLDGV